MGFTVGVIEIVILAILLDRITQTIRDKNAQYQTGPVSLSDLLLKNSLTIKPKDRRAKMKYMHKTILTTVIAVSATLSSAARAEKRPSECIDLQPLQSTVAEETFKTLIVNKAMQALGYTINAAQKIDYHVAYTSIAVGDATYLVDNWRPLLNLKYKAAGGNDKFYRKGEYTTGAGQGYIIDKKTAQKAIM
jgi:ABC-type proline/glycine betaine transport system substrate-binding protein